MNLVKYQKSARYQLGGSKNNVHWTLSVAVIYIWLSPKQLTPIWINCLNILFGCWFFNLIPGRLFGGSNQYTFDWLNFRHIIACVIFLSLLKLTNFLCFLIYIYYVLFRLRKMAHTLSSIIWPVDVKRTWRTNHYPFITEISNKWYRYVSIIFITLSLSLSLYYLVKKMQLK